ncbi:MAG: histidine kinase dimerization/phosphoacceptor domain-containing protein, partial [Actinobacteria bacterium]|nr:histidine kinase dimerization/phosphoacceptor domain-containing protein [Actinomycetota bacterium]
MNVVAMRGSLSGRWGDAWLGLAAAGVTAAALSAGLTGPGKVPLDLAGWMLAPVIGLLLLVRRQLPVAVLLASTAALVAYYAAGYPPVGLALPLAGAFFSAAEAGRIRWAIAVAVVVLAVGYGYRSAIGQDPGFLFGYDLAQTLVVVGGVIAAGDAVRSRRRERAQAAQRAALAAEQREQEARRTIEQERGRLARDVHDVLAHTLAVVSLHSDVAAEALPDDPQAAAESLR